MLIKVIHYCIFICAILTISGCTTSKNINVVAQNQDVIAKPSLERKKERKHYTTMGLRTYVFGADSQYEMFHAEKVTVPTTEKRKLASAFYLQQYLRDLNINYDVMPYLRYHSSTQNKFSGAVVVNYKQYLGQHPIVGGGVTVLMDSHFQLVKITATLTDTIKPNSKINEKRLSKKNAVLIALKNITKKKVSEDIIKFDTDLAKYSVSQKINGWRLNSPFAVKTVYFSSSKGLKIGYKINVRVSSAKHETRHYGYIISAISGQILEKKNYLREHTRR